MQMYPVQKAPSPLAPRQMSSRSILILSAYLHTGLPSSLFPSDVPTKQCMHLSPMHATCPNPSHPPPFENIWPAVQVTNVLISCNCLHSLPTSSLLSPNTFGRATMKVGSTTSDVAHTCTWPVGLTVLIRMSVIIFVFVCKVQLSVYFSYLLSRAFSIENNFY
jgi:hypothetical protein